MLEDARDVLPNVRGMGMLAQKAHGIPNAM